MRLITALREGSYGHEMRDSADTKNLLKMEQIDPLDLCEIVMRSRGQDHEGSITGEKMSMSIS